MLLQAPAVELGGYERGGTTYTAQTFSVQTGSNLQLLGTDLQRRNLLTQLPGSQSEGFVLFAKLSHFALYKSVIGGPLPHVVVVKRG